MLNPRIESRPGGMGIGRLRVTKTRRDKIKHTYVIPAIERDVDIIFETEEKSVSVSLTPFGAIELVKRLLQNLPDHYIAADDELHSILADKLTSSHVDSTAVLEAIKARRSGQ